jgi:hypothetical protein
MQHLGMQFSGHEMRIATTNAFWQGHGVAQVLETLHASAISHGVVVGGPFG